MDEFALFHFSTVFYVDLCSNDGPLAHKLFVTQTRVGVSRLTAPIYMP